MPIMAYCVQWHQYTLDSRVRHDSLPERKSERELLAYNSMSFANIVGAF